MIRDIREPGPYLRKVIYGEAEHRRTKRPEKRDVLPVIVYYPQEVGKRHDLCPVKVPFAVADEQFDAAVADRLTECAGCSDRPHQYDDIAVPERPLLPGLIIMYHSLSDILRYYLSDPERFKLVLFHLFYRFIDISIFIFIFIRCAHVYEI